MESEPIRVNHHPWHSNLRIGRIYYTWFGPDLACSSKSEISKGECHLRKCLRNLLHNNTFAFLTQPDEAENGIKWKSE